MRTFGPAGATPNPIQRYFTFRPLLFVSLFSLLLLVVMFVGFYVLGGFVLALVAVALEGVFLLVLGLIYGLPEHTQEEMWHRKVLYVRWPRRFPGWADSEVLRAERAVLEQELSDRVEQGDNDDIAGIDG